MKIIFIFLLTASALLPQQSKLSKGVNYLTEFISSDYFVKLKSGGDDAALSDTLFLRAVDFYNGDISEALLALTFTTVPYNKVPLQIPFIKIVVYYPLVSHSDSVFKLKNENLPRYFFEDSPQTDYGDKDKLAHFFGSAFLEYSSRVFDFAELIGYFVEVFEESFQVQSEIDERDLRVNRLGIEFGKSLKKDKTILPSQIILQDSIIK